MLASVRPVVVAIGSLVAFKKTLKLEVFLKAEALKNYLFYNLKIQSDICGCGKFIVEYFKSVI